MALRLFLSEAGVQNMNLGYLINIFVWKVQRVYPLFFARRLVRLALSRDKPRGSSCCVGLTGP